MPPDQPSANGPNDLHALHQLIESIPGWLTRQQATVLAEEASGVARGSEGVVVEIGSHHGRSTVVLGATVPMGARMVAIDPFLPSWRYGSADTEQALRSNLERAGLQYIVEVLATTSRIVHRNWHGPVDLVYVDGKHDVRSTIHDIGWAKYLTLGGRLLIHDSFSSIGVTLAILFRILPGRDLRYIGRTGSLAVFERARPRFADRVAILREMPWWWRNVGIKVLLRLRLRPLARMVGHHDSADPY